MIGVNVLAHTVHDRARMYDWLTRTKPGLIVVADETDVATRCKAAAPGAIVAHRWIYDGDGSHATMTALAWGARFLPALPHGVVGYALNEPGGDWRALSAWLADVMSIAAAYNKPLIVGNFAVGNPPQSAIDAGDFDALLLAFNDFPQHWLGVHEYFQRDAAAEPWHVGRYKALQARAAQIGARGVRFAVTEAGRDVAGGPNDGWRAVMDEAEYSRQLSAQADIYRAAGIPLAVFCYGEGGSGRWQSFDIQDAPGVLAAITAYNTGTMPEGEDDVYKGPPGWKEARTKQAGVRVNVRGGAGLNHAPITTVATGDWLRPSGAPVKNGAYTWQRVTTNECATGYVALEVIELV